MMLRAGFEIIILRGVCDVKRKKNICWNNLIFVISWRYRQH